MSHIPAIETARLVLPVPSAQDADAHARFFADAQASAFYGGPLCRDTGHWALKGFGKVVVTLDGRTVGGCGLVHPDGWPEVETHFRDDNHAARKLTQALGGTFRRRDSFPDGAARDVFAIPTQWG